MHIHTCVCLCVYTHRLPYAYMYYINVYNTYMGFPGGSDGKESACNADLGLILGLGRSLGEENGYPLQYSCLEHPMDRRAWWATVYGVTEN